MAAKMPAHRDTGKPTLTRDLRMAGGLKTRDFSGLRRGRQAHSLLLVCPYFPAVSGGRLYVRTYSQVISIGK